MDLEFFVHVSLAGILARTPTVKLARKIAAALGRQLDLLQARPNNLTETSSQGLLED